MRRLQLRPSATKSPGLLAREVPLADTWSRLLAVRDQFGLTRVSDLTRLDTIGIPVFSAITPGSNDTISVYHGKGLTPLAAQVSAAMEAFERNAAALPLRPVRIASAERLAQDGVGFLDPADVHVRTGAHYRPDRPISWLDAWDLLEDRPVLVPHGAAAYGRAGHEPAVFHVITTSGIASGNSVEEAIAHALCEVVERDAVTLRAVADACHEQSGSHVGSPSRPVDLASVPQVARELVQRFHDAGVVLEVEHIVSDVGLPVFAARASDEGSGLGIQHGYGANPHATVALVRAITECAQSRAAELERLREDLQSSRDPVVDDRSEAEPLLVRRHPSSADGAATEPRSPATPVAFTTVPSFESDDIVEDIDVVKRALVAAGLTRVLVCDLTPPESPFAVVRLIVPGLETWAFDHSKLGARALDAWNRQATRSAETAPAPTEAAAP